MSEPRFDFADVFDEDYLYFYSEVIGDERTEQEVDLIWRLLELEPATEVLDLACGHGRIANRLAARGVRVTGLDASALFLDLARRAASERGVEVEYVEGDMRSLPWTERFDRVVIWFTSFGYFADDDNRRVLAEALRALRPGGRLGLEMNHLPVLLRVWQQDRVTERDGDFMIDRGAYDPQTGRAPTERIVIRDGRVRRFQFSVRMFTFMELRDWLLHAGFEAVEGHGMHGEPLSMESRRMIAVARKPSQT
jgi:SAM-dependent methyltransferase